LLHNLMQKLLREPGGRMARISAPVDEATLRFVLAHATELGLPARASQARVVARVFELGAERLARLVRDAERERLYAEWADDPERRAAARFHEEAAAETAAF
jgi:hypothetical protein